MHYKVLLVGVSEYLNTNEDLPVCAQDVIFLTNTLVKHLGIPSNAITSMSGKVTKADFDQSFSEFLKRPADTSIFYFTGHGTVNDAGHCLCLSDRIAVTNILIENMAKSSGSSLIIIDSCCSGEAKPHPALERAVDSACGTGCAVIASCGPKEASWSVPNTTMSVFTALLCDALRFSYSFTQGMKSLDSVERLLRHYLKRWNEKNPELSQHPVIRHDMQGTLLFPDPAFIPYVQITTPTLKSEIYSIEKVEPLHSSKHKRYSVKVLLSHDPGLADLSSPVSEIVDFAKKQQVFTSERQENYFSSKKVTHVFVSLFLSQMDLTHNITKYQLIWVDESLDRTHWHKGEGVLLNDCWITETPMYDLLHEHIENNQLDDAKATDIVIDLFERVDSLGKKVFNNFDEYLNRLISEEELIRFFHSYIPESEELIKCSMDLGYADEFHEKLIGSVTGLTGSLERIINFYTAEKCLQANTRNREQWAFGVRDTYSQDFYSFKERLTAIRTNQTSNE
ncbi:MAG: caspase family protein [Coriobacteriales bacterium]|nr:caspase family protein [Coriobacteriales bacterium]